jgi:uncharacterized RDD family membrane protein YckC
MSEGRTNKLMIRTPEGVVFSLHLAGPVTRCLAWMLDLVVVIACAFLTLVLTLQFAQLSAGLAYLFVVIGYFAFSIGYGVATEWLWKGRTVGKRFLGLQVVDVHGLRLQFSQVVIRNLLRAVDSLPAFYLLGGLVCVLSGRAQRLGDLAANTVVIRVPDVAQPNLDQLLGDRFNSLREHPHPEARLRQCVSPAEAAVGLQAMQRRHELDPESRVALFGEIAGQYRMHAEFPAEATTGMTDEQYVRNVVDILYRPRAGRSGA